MSHFKFYHCVFRLLWISPDSTAVLSEKYWTFLVSCGSSSRSFVAALADEPVYTARDSAHQGTVWSECRRYTPMYLLSAFPVSKICLMSLSTLISLSRFHFCISCVSWALQMFLFFPLCYIGFLFRILSYAQCICLFA